MRPLYVVFGVIIAVLFVTGLFVSKSNKGAISPQPHAEQTVAIEHLSPQAKKIVEEALPKINNRCPGVKKYAKSLRVVEITDTLDASAEEYRKVTIRLKVTDGESDIPNEYKAWGHFCNLDIAADGKSVTIMKDACKSVLLDQLVDDPAGRNLVIPLGNAKQ